MVLMSPPYKLTRTISYPISAKDGVISCSIFCSISIGFPLKVDHFTIKNPLFFQKSSTFLKNKVFYQIITFFEKCFKFIDIMPDFPILLLNNYAKHTFDQYFLPSQQHKKNQHLYELSSTREKPYLHLVLGI